MQFALLFSMGLTPETADFTCSVDVQFVTCTKGNYNVIPSICINRVWRCNRGAVIPVKRDNVV
jgi:hypothetical protein